MQTRRIADSTVRRLSLYLQFLEAFEAEGQETVSSEALALRGGTTSAQVRKDLSMFGSFGKRGLGYSVPELAREVREILGMSRRYRVVVIGVGKLGSALVHHRGFRERGFDVVAIFDNDPEKIGRLVDGVMTRDESRLEEVMAEMSPDIAVLATPAEEAQDLVDRLVAGGIRAILNFAPAQLVVPDQVALRNVNLSLELEALSFALANR